MRQLVLIAGASLALAACNTASAGTLPPTTLPQSTIVDDQFGTSVELAYQAASLGERTAVKAGFVSPTQAKSLILLDNEAYTAVCTVRSAYDVANGKDPAQRVDTCPQATKQNKYVSYAQAAQAALEMIRLLVGSTQQSLAVNGH